MAANASSRSSALRSKPQITRHATPLRPSTSVSQAVRSPASASRTSRSTSFGSRRVASAIGRSLFGHVIATIDPAARRAERSRQKRVAAEPGPRHVTESTSAGNGYRNSVTPGISAGQRRMEAIPLTSVDRLPYRPPRAVEPLPRSGERWGAWSRSATLRRAPAWVPGRCPGCSTAARRVSETTRAKVLATIEELGYRPNPLAQGLSRGRCQTLGVVVPFFTHASAVERLRGVAAALDGSRYDLVIFNVEQPVHRDEFLATLTRRDRADGLLIMSIPPPPDALQRILDGGVPVVADRRRRRRRARRRAPTTSKAVGSPPATSWAWVTSASRSSAASRTTRSGSCRRPSASAATARCWPPPGLGVDDPLVRHGAHDREVALPITNELLARPDPPTAIFATSDIQALGRDRGGPHPRACACPSDLSVIGFDDIELAAYVGLTTVRQPLFQSGALGARLLLEVLSGEGAPAAVRARASARARRRGPRPRPRPGRT